MGNKNYDFTFFAKSFIDLVLNLDYLYQITSLLHQISLLLHLLEML